MKNNDLDLIFYFGEYFLNHKHDLIHKALGWMLREVGKRDEKRLKEFLKENLKMSSAQFFNFLSSEFISSLLSLARFVLESRSSSIIF